MPRLRHFPNLSEEKKLWKKGYKNVVCIDEVGRGPLAGPVMAAAVATSAKFKMQNSKLQFKVKNSLKGIRDSKKLTLKKREEFYKILIKHPNIKWGIGRVSEKMIDKINIKNATELAMVRALNNLKKNFKVKPDFLIIDGNHIKNLKLKTYNLKLMVKADEKVFSCALASVLAKVRRDRLMKKYHQKYPQYGFDKNKGYATKHHLEALRKHGLCPLHRKSFSPVKLANQSNLC